MDKIFIIGGSFISDRLEDLKNIEVFDSVTRKFTSIKVFPKWIEYLDPNKTVCVGYNIYYFLGEENNKVKVYSYNAKNNLFSFKTLLNFENNKTFSCTKVSMY